MEVLTTHQITGLGKWVRSSGFLLAISIILSIQVAEAKPLKFTRADHLQYHLRETVLSDFLRQFFNENNIRLMLSDKVAQSKRTLNGPRQGTPEEIYQSIEQSNGLASYFDGNTIYICFYDEIQHEFFRIEPENIANIQASADRLQLNGKHNYVSIDQTTGLAEVIGVPYFIDYVSRMIEAMTQTSRHTVFKYFPLKYAWATDRTFTAGNNEIKVKGLANMLRDILYGGYNSDSGFSEVSDTVSRVGKNNRVDSVVAHNRPGHENRSEQKHHAQSGSPGLYQGSGDGASRIVADPQHNAIIVRDYPDRIQLYEELIKKLDVPIKLIEIEAAIIDVHVDKLKEIGIDWRYSDKNSEVMFSQPGGKNDFLNVLAGGSISALSQQAGFQIGAIIGNKEQFLARLNMLENKGVISIYSRPKVATLDDHEAVIENSKSLFVPVQGAYDVDLFKVYSGTVLRVTPHMIEHDSHREIRMIVAVEDGSVEVMGEKGTPVATRNAVSTQAIIREGKSLLLGGHVREQKSTDQSKVPVLGDIPWVGRLFKNTSEAKVHTERLFLITPRIVSASGMDADKLDVPNYSENKILKENHDSKGCGEGCERLYSVKELHMF